MQRAELSYKSNNKFRNLLLPLKRDTPPLKRRRNELK